MTEASRVKFGVDVCPKLIYKLGMEYSLQVSSHKSGVHAKL
jgi:hypothetical protein